MEEEELRAAKGRGSAKPTTEEILRHAPLTPPQTYLLEAEENPYATCSTDVFLSYARK